MSQPKQISLLGASVQHPGRGEPSRIELAVVLDYLNNNPVAIAVLSPGQALRLAEQLVRAATVVGEIE